MTIGIYKLNFTGTDKTYVGQSINIERRFKEHIVSLKKGFANCKLLNAFIHYGTPTIEILCECSALELNKLEDEAIEIFNSVDNGFNLLFNATTAVHGEKNPNSKYSNEEIICVFNLLLDPKIPFKEISKITGVHYNTIAQIAALNTHNWLQEKFPQKYIALIKAKNMRQKGMHVLYPLIKDPSKVVYSITSSITTFAKEHNLGISGLSKLLKGKGITHRGWTLA